MLRGLLTVLLVALAGLAQAQEDQAWLEVGQDVFGAGYALRHTAPGADDVFLAGNTLTLSASVTGDVGLAGQTIAVGGDVGEDVYAAGQTLTLTGTVAGDATLFGQNITVSGPVQGDLRSAGAFVSLLAPVGGNVVLGGDTVEVNAAIAGDAHIGATAVLFGPDTQIGGTLHLYEDHTTPVALPDALRGTDVQRHSAEEFEDMTEPAGFGLLDFLRGVLIVAALAAILAVLAPAKMAGMRVTLLERPFRGLWMGFLGLSALVGAGILSALTLVGLIATPAFWLVAVLAGLLGYVIAAYALGVGLMRAIGMDEPSTVLVRVGAALLGALIAAVIGLLPYIGWLSVLVLSAAGAGALVVQVLRPRFFGEKA